MVAYIKLSVRKIPPNFALLVTKKSKKRFPTAFQALMISFLREFMLRKEEL